MAGRNVSEFAGLDMGLKRIDGWGSVSSVTPPKYSRSGTTVLDLLELCQRPATKWHDWNWTGLARDRDPYHDFMSGIPLTGCANMVCGHMCEVGT